MPLEMPLEIPWTNTSVFIPSGNFVSGDILVGLRSGINRQFNSPVGQFLQILNNLSDVADIRTSAANLGLSNGYVIYSDNANHTLTSPLPEVIGLGNTSTQTFTLPEKSALNINSFGRMYFINNYGSAAQNFHDSLDNQIFTVNASTNYIFVIPDQLSSSYYIFPLVSSVNGNSGNTVVDLNSAYSETSGHNLNATNGLNITGSDTSFLGISGNYLFFNNPIDVGIDDKSSYLFFMGTTPTAIDLQYMQIYGGFSNQISGQESGYMSLQILDNGSVHDIFQLTGTRASGELSRADFISINQVGINVGSINDCAIFQADSTSQGILFPRMTTSQRNAITSPVAGMQIYNSTFNTFDYFDGADYETILTGGNALAGNNMTIVSNSDGTYTFNASGSGGGSAAAYASLSIQNNTTSTSFSSTSTFYPVYLGTSFVGSDASNFTNQFLSSTPMMTYTGSSSQFFNININLTCRGAVPSVGIYVFSIYIRLSNGTIVPTQYRNTLSLGDLINYYDVSLTGNILLNQGDSIYIAVANISNTNSMYAAYATYSVISLSGSIPNTDSLPQGTNNFYLSQNGGSSFQNVSGSVFGGNIAVFSGNTGLISDGGAIQTAARKFASDNTKSGVASVFSATASGNMLIAADTMGTVKDGGLPPASISTVTGTSFTMTTTALINIINLQNAVSTTTTVTLPASGLVAGQIFKVCGGGSGLWIIAQNSGQLIVFPSGGVVAKTTIGVGGSVSAQTTADCIEIQYNSANQFVVLNQNNSGITYV